MKLLKCYVSSFGKLKEYYYEFSDGINCIKHENGWGKSTLGVFIKAMFYGLDDSKRSVSENERQKYKPWNSIDKFGGYLEFERDFNRYRVERFFGNKQSEDTIKIIELSSGKILPSVSNLGATLFEIDEEGFLSTAFLSQKDFQVKSNSSITAKYNSLCEVNDSESFDKAINLIESKAKTYKYRGDKGLITDTKREIFTIDERILQINNLSNTVEERKNDVSNIEGELIELKNKTEELTSKLANYGRTEALSIKKEHADESKKLKEELESQKAVYFDFFNGYIPVENEIKAYIECDKELNKISIMESVLVSDIETLSESKIENNRKAKLLTSGLLFGLSFVLLLVLIVLLIGNGFIFFVTLPSILISLSFVMCITLAIVLNRKKGAFLQGLNDRDNILEKKKNELLQYRDIKNKYSKNIDNFIGRFNFEECADRTIALDLISKTLNNYNNCLGRIAEIDKQIKVYLSDENFNEHDNVENENPALIRKEIEKLQNQYLVKSTELADLRYEVKTHTETIDLLPSLESKKSELIVKLNQYNEEYKTLETTSKYLRMANDNLRAKYKVPLQEGLNKYLSYITGKKILAKIDVDMSITIEENGSAKVVDFYSKGYQNLFEICKRFALIDVLFAGEKPFIILDDPFSNLDDDKLPLTTSLINKLSKEHQVIYFVCHESRVVGNV